MRRARVFAALVLALTMGCAGNREPAGDESDRRTVIVVDNSNWQDVNVFAVRNGTRFRLGTVASNQTRRFALPRMLNTAAGDVRLFVDLIGSRMTHLTQPLNIVDGDRVDLRIHNHLALSNFMVRRAGAWN